MATSLLRSNVMIKNRRVFNFASLGVNAGDDAMNIVLVSLLRQLDTRCYVMSMDCQRTRRLLGVDSTVLKSSYRSLFRWMHAIARSDAVVVGGGTIVQADPRSSIVSGILLKATVVAAIARLFRVPVYCIGIGAAPLSRRVDGYLAKRLLKWSAGICVRDEASKKLIEGLIPTKAEKDPLVDLMPDLAFGLQADCNDRKEVSRPGRLFISVVGESHHARGTAVLREVVPAALAHGREVVLVAMDAQQTEELGIYKQYLDQLDERQRSNVSTIVIEDPRQLLGAFSPMDIAVGMRLHFCILALAAGLDPIVISREQKTSSLTRYRNNLEIIDIENPDLLGQLNRSLVSRFARERDDAFYATTSSIGAAASDVESAVMRTLRGLRSGDAAAPARST